MSSLPAMQLGSSAQDVKNARVTRPDSMELLGFRLIESALAPERTGDFLFISPSGIYVKSIARKTDRDSLAVVCQ